MTGISNPTSLRYSMALEGHSRNRKDLMDSATSGLKNDLSVVDSLYGKRTLSDAQLGEVVKKSMRTGMSIFSTANATLGSVDSILRGMKLDIVSLNSGVSDTLALDNGQKEFLSKAAQINKILEHTGFAGKHLFDGTFAAKPTTLLPSQVLPTDAGPLALQYGISTGEVNYGVIAKLSAGNGSAKDVAKEGVHQPLFPHLNDIWYKANNKATQIKNAIEPSTVNAEDELTEALLLGLADDNAVNAQNDDDIHKYAFAVNTAMAAQRLRLNTVSARGHLNSIQTDIDAALNAAETYLKTTLTAEDATTEVTAQNITDAVTNVKAAITTAITGKANVGAARLAVAAINVKPTEANASSMLKSVYNTLSTAANVIAKAGYDMATNVDATTGIAADDPINAEVAKKAINDVIANTITTVNALTGPIGNIDTNAGRTKALAMIDAALNNTVASVSAEITGFLNSCITAQDNLDTLITQLSDAAKSYLEANYEEIIPKLLEISRKDKVASIAFFLSEKALNATFDQLASAAAAA